MQPTKLLPGSPMLKGSTSVLLWNGVLALTKPNKPCFDLVTACLSWPHAVLLQSCAMTLKGFQDLNQGQLATSLHLIPPGGEEMQGQTAGMSEVLVVLCIRDVTNI